MPSRLLLPLLALPILQMPAKLEACRPTPPSGEAMIVVQIAGHRVSGADSLGLCKLTGPAVRSFRGPLPPEALVEVLFPCTPAAMHQGQDWWVVHDPDAVAEAAAVEVHATAQATVAYGGLGLLLLEAPTEEPARALDPWSSAPRDCAGAEARTPQAEGEGTASWESSAISYSNTARRSGSQSSIVLARASSK